MLLLKDEGEVMCCRVDKGPGFSCIGCVDFQVDCVEMDGLGKLNFHGEVMSPA